LCSGFSLTLKKRRRTDRFELVSNRSPGCQASSTVTRRGRGSSRLLTTLRSRPTRSSGSPPESGGILRPTDSAQYRARQVANSTISLLVWRGNVAEVQISPIRSKGEYLEARHVLRISLWNDPIFKNLWFDDEERHQVFTRIFSDALISRHSKIATYCNQVIGAMTLEIGTSRSLTVKIRDRLTKRFLYRLNPRAADRFYDGITQVSSEFPKSSDGIHLQFIGVIPVHQRLGAGTKLIESVIDTADKSTLVCHTETAFHDNLKYFERFGFVAVSECRALSFGNNPLWYLIRRPRFSGMGAAGR
jgi:GNAT superfamily N-acetyltransferase